MPSDHMPCPPSPDPERNREVVYIRIPSSLRERVDAHREALQRSAAAGVNVTFSAAIRNLLETALSAHSEAA